MTKQEQSNFNRDFAKWLRETIANKQYTEAWNIVESAWAFRKISGKTYYALENYLSKLMNKSSTWTPW